MAAEQTLVNAPKVTVDGQVLDQFWANKLMSLSLEVQYQVPARLTMRFFTPMLGESTQPFPFELNGAIKVAFPIGQAGQGARLVEACGELFVTEIGSERDTGGVAEYVVVAHDASYRLTRRHQVVTFANMSASDVVSKVAQGAGLKPKQVDATSEVLPYLLQADSDFGFITTLARRYGYDWWVDGEDLYFTKPSSSPDEIRLNVLDDLLRFSVSQTAVPHKRVTVNGWDRDNQELVTGQANAPSSPKNAVPGMSDSKNGITSSLELETASLRAATRSEADTLAATIASRQVASTVEAQGEVLGHPDIKPGIKLAITGDHFEGDYLVTRVEHRFVADGYTTRFSAGDRVPTGLADFLAGSSLPEQMGAYSSLPPLIPAVVTTIGTGENLGRDKVKFPYLSEENESHWARVLSAGGGPERGFWFLPEVDDEVLVSFEGGDTRFPVVMGGLYGAVTTPEDELIQNGQIASRSVRSRLGHYMDFVDGTKDTEKHIMLGLGRDGKPGTDYKLRMGEDRFDIEVPEGKPISIKAGKAQITFTDDKSISVSADNVTIKADADLKLEGRSVSVKGQQSVELSQGGNKVSMGTSGTDVKGAPTTSIKGGPQVSIG